jgi:cyclopropane fatty-acyl-phospholipid synthase-like methyltransferase
MGIREESADGSRPRGAAKGSAPEARSFFDSLWKEGDYWELETSEFERQKYAAQLMLLGDDRFERVLEIGCAAGTFTRLLAQRAGYVLGVDVSAEAVERALRSGDWPAHVELKVDDVMVRRFRADERWDLVVMSETIYYVGWLHSFFDVAWMASRLFASVRPGGRFLMCNTIGTGGQSLMRPWILQTYRDLFVNVGFHVEREEEFKGLKHGVELEAVMSLFRRSLEKKTRCA